MFILRKKYFKVFFKLYLTPRNFLRIFGCVFTFIKGQNIFICFFENPRKRKRKKTIVLMSGHVRLMSSHLPPIADADSTAASDFSAPPSCGPCPGQV